MFSSAKISVALTLMAVVTSGRSDDHTEPVFGSDSKSGKVMKTSKSAKGKSVKASSSGDCVGAIPGMLGEYAFYGYRFEGANTNGGAPDPDLTSWDQGTSKRPIAGIEWVPWVDGPYYLLAINSPAGLVRRFCTFDAKDNRTSVCTGMDERDETVTETLFVTKTDEECNAMAFTIVTTKAWTPDDTAISNMFVDHVQGERTRYEYPLTPADVDDFACTDCEPH